VAQLWTPLPGPPLSLPQPKAARTHISPVSRVRVAGELLWLWWSWWWSLWWSLLWSSLLLLSLSSFLSFFVIVIVIFLSFFVIVIVYVAVAVVVTVVVVVVVVVAVVPIFIRAAMCDRGMFDRLADDGSVPRCF
jgi:type IV secretory pathway VirB6-like protein